MAGSSRGNDLTLVVSTDRRSSDKQIKVNGDWKQIGITNKWTTSQELQFCELDSCTSTSAY